VLRTHGIYPYAGKVMLTSHIPSYWLLLQEVEKIRPIQGHRT
jgi:hypothetical protein